MSTVLLGLGSDSEPWLRTYTHTCLLPPKLCTVNFMSPIVSSSEAKKEDFEQVMSKYEYMSERTWVKCRQVASRCNQGRMGLIAEGDPLRISHHRAAHLTFFAMVKKIRLRSGPSGGIEGEVKVCRRGGLARRRAALDKVRLRLCFFPIFDDRKESISIGTKSTCAALTNKRMS